MIDEKEHAWLRLKAFELVTHGWHERGDSDAAEALPVADKLYQWAITGEVE